MRRIVIASINGLSALDLPTREITALPACFTWDTFRSKKKL